MDNYAISRDRAQSYFLSFDQTKIIRRWQLDFDENCLYTTFLGKKYRISRKDGTVIRAWDDTQAEFSEVLSIFDLLCHSRENAEISGHFAPVNSLKGAPKAGGVETNFHSAFAKRIDEDPQGFCSACNALGAQRVNMGDIGFRFPIFQELDVILKFYHSDEDFPAGITFLWDENILQYLYYETVFYIAGFLANTITKIMDRATVSD